MKIALINKKIGLIVILAVFFLLAIAGSGWAITVWNEGYRVNHSGGTADVIVAGPTGACYKVTNNNNAIDYFIPTKTQAEWDAFVANKPANVTVETCLGIWTQVSQNFIPTGSPCTPSSCPFGSCSPVGIISACCDLVQGGITIRGVECKP